MNSKPPGKGEIALSRVFTVIIFLALIRCVAEPFRLQYYTATPLTLGDIKPYLIGAIVTALSLLFITLLAYYQKHKLIIILAVLTILSLFVVKAVYMK